MKDLIERGNAIDAINRVCDRDCEYPKEVRANMCVACPLGSAYNAIQDMPSAQPEQRWIPVSEKLPNFAQRVLVSISNFVYEAIYFDEDAGWSTYNVTFKDVEESEILAWMPLPEPYKGEQA